MTFQYASDLHLEFPENRDLLINRPIKPIGEMLILAGDILPLDMIEEFSWFFDYLSYNYKETYWLPGNHEFYHSDLMQRGSTLNEKIKENVHLVNNTSVRIKDFKFIFSTLWTKISPGSHFELLLGYSDFRAIRNNGVLLSISQYNLLHERCLSFLSEELSGTNTGPLIVATHHMPTFMSYPLKYGGSAFNEVFAVELYDLINKSGPDHWIFGHAHERISDFKIGKTMLTSNPLGYVMYNEHAGFDSGRIISI